MTPADDTMRMDATADAHEAAKSLIARLGEQATCHATYQALKARRHGDRFTMEQWLWIAGATREILRTQPEMVS